jgi:hypothetical protein
VVHPLADQRDRLVDFQGLLQAMRPCQQPDSPGRRYLTQRLLERRHPAAAQLALDAVATLQVVSVAAG